MKILTLLLLLEVTLSYPFKSDQEYPDSGVTLNARANDNDYPSRAQEIVNVFIDMKKPSIKEYNDHMVYYINSLQAYEANPDDYMITTATIHDIQVGVINGLYYSVLHHKGTEHSDFYYNLFCIIFPHNEMDDAFLQGARDTIVSYLKRDLSHWGEINNDIRTDIKIMLGLQENELIGKKRSNDIGVLKMEDFWFHNEMTFNSYNGADSTPASVVANGFSIEPTSTYPYATLDIGDLYATGPPQEYASETSADFSGNDGTARSLAHFNELIDQRYLFLDIDKLYEHLHANVSNHRCVSYVYGLESDIDGTIANTLLVMNRFYNEFNSRGFFNGKCFEMDHIEDKRQRIRRGVTNNRYRQKNGLRTHENDEQPFNSGMIHGLTYDEAVRYTRVGYVLRDQNQKQGHDLQNRWSGVEAHGGGTYDLKMNYQHKIPFRKDDPNSSHQVKGALSPVAGTADCVCVFVYLDQRLQNMDLKSSAELAIKG